MLVTADRQLVTLRFPCPSSQLCDPPGTKSREEMRRSCEDMEINLAVPATLAAAALVLVTGRRLTGRINLLRKYSIPEAVAGGLVAAVLIAALHAANVQVSFDTS